MLKSLKSNVVINIKRIVISFVFITLLSVLLASCQQKNEILLYEFKNIKTVEIPVDSSVNANSLFYGQYLTMEGRDVFVAYYWNSAFLWFYDVETKTLSNKLPLDYRLLQGFYVQNKDSVYVMYMNMYMDGVIDSTMLQLVDYEGNVKRNYRLDYPAIIADYNPEYNMETGVYPINYSGNLRVNNNKIILFFESYMAHQVGTPEFMEARSPVIGVFDVETEHLNVCEDYWYPNADTGVYYPSDMYPFSACFNEKGNPVIRYMYSSVLTEWDMEENTLTEHQLKSKLLDTIMPACQAKTHTGNEIAGEYYRLYFDPYRKMYYSILFFNRRVFGPVGYSNTIADQGFNNCTEIYKPPWSSVGPFFTENYVVGLPLNKRDRITLDYYRVDQVEASRDDTVKIIRDRLQTKKDSVRSIVKDLEVNCDTKDSENCIIYVNSTIGIPEDDYVLITVFLDEGCPACCDFILKILSEKHELLCRKPLYLLMSASSEAAFDKVYNQYDLGAYDRLKADKDGFLKTILKESKVNPRLTVVKNNKIVLDTIYLADQLDSDFMNSLSEGLGLNRDINSVRNE